jgi:hypothetical protein
MAAGKESNGCYTFIPPPVVIEREESDGSVTKVGTVKRVAVRTDRLLNPRKGLQREEQPTPPPVTFLRDYLLPALFIVAGIALCFLDGTYKGEDGWRSLREVRGPVSINIVASLALVVGAVFAASAMGGIAFTEPVPIIIYKLCAVALAPGAVGSLALRWIGGLNGDIAGVFIGIACYFALFVLLFRLSMADRIVCVLLVFIIRAAVAYLIFKFEGMWKGSEI